MLDLAAALQETFFSGRKVGVDMRVTPIFRGDNDGNIYI